MYEQMVDEVIKEVLRRLRYEEGLPSMRDKTLLVLSEGPYSISETLKKEYQILFKDLKIHQNKMELEDMVNASDLILVTSLTVEQLVNLSLGSGDGQLEEMIRYGLLLGKSIFVLEDGLLHRAYKATAHKTYYRRLLEYEESIKSYGIQITTEATLCYFDTKKVQTHIPMVQKELVSRTQEIGNREEMVTLHKKLIVEKDLMALDNRTQSVICIETNSIITPSALDYARAHRMRFIKK